MRKRSEEVILRELARCIRTEQAAAERLAACREGLSEEVRACQAESRGRIDMARFTLRQDRLSALRAAYRAAEAALAEAEKSRVVSQEAASRARAARLSLERLREEAYAAYLRAEARLEQKRLDEVAHQSRRRGGALAGRGF